MTDLIDVLLKASPLVNLILTGFLIRFTYNLERRIDSHIDDHGNWNGLDRRLEKARR